MKEEEEIQVDERHNKKIKLNDEKEAFTETTEEDVELKELQLMINCLHSIGMKQDREKAKQICLKYEEKGNVFAKMMKLNFLDAPQEIAEILQNFPECFKILEEQYKSNQNHKNKFYLCFGFYSLSRAADIFSSKVKQMEYLNSAIELGNCVAMYEFAVLLIESDNPNLEQIKELLQRSADLKCAEAIKTLFSFQSRVPHERLEGYLDQLLEYCGYELDIQITLQIKNILSCGKIGWKESYHHFWNRSNDLDGKLLCLLCISKYRRECKMKESSILIKYLVMKIIKYLCLLSLKN